MGTGNDEIWPDWPSEGKIDRISRVGVACKAEELFLLLWGPNSPFVEKCQELLGNKDFKETWWAPKLEDLAKGKEGKPPQKQRAAAEYKGMFRKNACSGSGLGLKYINTELQRCLEASDNGPFEVDVIVQTTATYGDRFRPIIKHRIVSTGPASCTYTIDYAMVYIASTNGLLKRAIERGATQGVTKNFQIIMEVLGTFETVTEADVEPIKAAASKDDLHKDAVSTVEAIDAAAAPAWWLKSLSTEESAQLMQAPAAFLASSIGQGGSLGVACRASLSWLDLPRSTRQVLSVALLFTLANLSLGYLRHLLTPEPGPKIIALRRTGSGRKVAVAIDQPPEEGIRYDGYQQSLESAAANIAEGEVELRRRNRSLSSMPSGALTQRRRDHFKEGLKSGFKNLMEHTRWPRREEGAGQEALASPGAPSPGALSPGAPSHSLGAQQPSSPPYVTSAFANTRDPFPASQPKRAATKRKPSAGEADLPKGRENPGRKPASLSDEESGESQQNGLNKASMSTGGTLRDFMNPGGLLDKTENMLGGLLGAAPRPGQKTAATPQQQVKAAPAVPLAQPVKRDAASEYEAQQEARQHSTTMELADLGTADPEEALGVVEEEIFENERYQPFRAWGHTWPGHFLPTDRVGHWSVDTPTHSLGIDTSDFDAVAPTLKKDWEWKEDAWQIDISGLAENTVDEEGWCYATDFSYIKWPPVPGQGRFRRVRDYVRRRRWFRSRVFAGVQLQESPSKPSPAMHPTASAPVIASLLSEELSKAQSKTPQAETVTSPPSRKGSESLASTGPARSESAKEVEELSSGNEGASSLQQTVSWDRESLQSLSETPRDDATPVSQTNAASRPNSREGVRGGDSRLKHWKDRLVKGGDSGIGSSGSSETRKEGERRRLRAEERKPPSEAGSDSGLNFTERMSSMFAAASNTLRPSSAKRDEPRSLFQVSKPAMGRESSSTAGARQVAPACRSGSGDLVGLQNGPKRKDPRSISRSLPDDRLSMDQRSKTSASTDSARLAATLPEAARQGNSRKATNAGNAVSTPQAASQEVAGKAGTAFAANELGSAQECTEGLLCEAVGDGRPINSQSARSLPEERASLDTMERQGSGRIATPAVQQSTEAQESGHQTAEHSKEEQPLLPEPLARPSEPEEGTDLVSSRQQGASPDQGDHGVLKKQAAVGDPLSVSPAKRRSVNLEESTSDRRAHRPARSAAGPTEIDSQIEPMGKPRTTSEATPTASAGSSELIDEASPSVADQQSQGGIGESVSAEKGKDGTVPSVAVASPEESAAILSVALSGDALGLSSEQSQTAKLLETALSGNSPPPPPHAASLATIGTNSVAPGAGTSDDTPSSKRSKDH